MATNKVAFRCLVEIVFLSLWSLSGNATTCATVWDVVSPANAGNVNLSDSMSKDKPEYKYLLSLSGGGYRAMLFHLGALRRLNDAGLLKRLDMVSSVSGGSITAGVLAKAWKQLDFNDLGVATNFDDLVTKPLMKVAGKTIDTPSTFIGLLPFMSVSEQVERRYREHLYGDMNLGQLPESPIFVFNATSLQTGEIWHFGKSRMGGNQSGGLIQAIFL